jgi:hypothetical protein
VKVGVFQLLAHYVPQLSMEPSKAKLPSARGANLWTISDRPIWSYADWSYTKVWFGRNMNQHTYISVFFVGTYFWNLVGSF